MYITDSKTADTIETRAATNLKVSNNSDVYNCNVDGGASA